MECKLQIIIDPGGRQFDLISHFSFQISDFTFFTLPSFCKHCLILVKAGRILIEVSRILKKKSRYNRNELINNTYQA